MDKKIERKRSLAGQIVEREKEVAEGGILHWGRETENKELLEGFRQEIIFRVARVSYYPS